MVPDPAKAAKYESRKEWKEQKAMERDPERMYPAPIHTETVEAGQERGMERMQYLTRHPGTKLELKHIPKKPSR